MLLSGTIRTAIERDLLSSILNNSSIMNDISFADFDFYVVLIALGSMGFLVGLLRFTVLKLQRRRNLRLETVSKGLRPFPGIRSTSPRKQSVTRGANGDDHRRRPETRSSARFG